MAEKSNIDSLRKGDLVFAKSEGYIPWPAKVIEKQKKHCLLNFLGTDDIRRIIYSKIWSYSESNKIKFITSRDLEFEQFRDAVIIAETLRKHCTEIDDKEYNYRVIYKKDLEEETGQNESDQKESSQEDASLEELDHDEPGNEEGSQKKAGKVEGNQQEGEEASQEESCQVEASQEEGSQFGQEESRQKESRQEKSDEKESDEEECDEEESDQAESDHEKSSAEESDQEKTFDQQKFHQQEFDQEDSGQDKSDNEESGQDESYEKEFGQEESYEKESGQEEFDEEKSDEKLFGLNEAENEEDSQNADCHEELGQEDLFHEENSLNDLENENFLMAEERAISYVESLRQGRDSLKAGVEQQFLDLVNVLRRSLKFSQKDYPSAFSALDELHGMSFSELLLVRNFEAVNSIYHLCYLNTTHLNYDEAAQVRYLAERLMSRFVTTFQLQVIVADFMTFFHSLSLVYRWYTSQLYSRNQQWGQEEPSQEAMTVEEPENEGMIVEETAQEAMAVEEAKPMVLEQEEYAAVESSNEEPLTSIAKFDVLIYILRSTLTSPWINYSAALPALEKLLPMEFTKLFLLQKYEAVYFIYDLCSYGSVLPTQGLAMATQVRNLANKLMARFLEVFELPDMTTTYDFMVHFASIYNSDSSETDQDNE